MCTGVPINRKRMFAGLPTTHVHASVCSKDFWFCVLLEAWARGKYPGKEYVLQKIDEVEAFINGLNNNCIEHYRLICVPLKDGADGKAGEDGKKPPRIALVGVFWGIFWLTPQPPETPQILCDWPAGWVCWKARWLAGWLARSSPINL